MLNLVLSLSLSHTGHWKFNMAPDGKELLEDLKKIIVALDKDDVGYKKIAKIQRLCLGNGRMSAASIAAEVEGVGGQPVSAQTICHTLHQIGLHGCRPRRKPLLKMMHKKD